MGPGTPILMYIGGKLPCLTETFVYREVISLRDKGWTVHTMSVHEPDLELGDIKIDSLAIDSVRIYSQGTMRLLKKAIKEIWSHPRQSYRTFCNSLKIIISNRSELSIVQSIKFIGQTIAALSVADELRIRSVTHIHAHFAHVPTSFAMVLSEHLSLPFSFTGHAVDLFSESCLLKTKLEKAAFCACISEWHQKYYQSICSLENDRLPIVRCGLDPNMFSSQKSAKENFRKLELVTVSRLVPKKGIDLLIRALDEVDFGTISWSCRIIGDGPERKNLESLIKSSKHADKIFLVGSKSHNEVKEILQRSHIFILPCRVDSTGNRDGIPVALMEAMACENAVVSGDFPQIRELIHDGDNGILVEPDNIIELIHAISKLVNDRKYCAELGAAARKHVCSEFTENINIQRLQHAFLKSPSKNIIDNRLNTFLERKREALQTTGNYVIISPCRNEGKYLVNTLESVVNQTVLPKTWVIVNDGSTDNTGEVLEKYAKKYGFIKIVNRENRGFRKVGPGVVDAFYTGYEAINPEEYDYICKLDLDLKLPVRYFETLIYKMESDPRIGTCSGRPYFINEKNQIEMESSSDDISAGMTKFYRLECFKEINGIVRAVMWDGIDCHTSRMLGWTSYSWDEANLRFIHLRPMGSSEKGLITGRMRHGFGQYFMGTDLLFITASSIYRLNQHPFIIGGIAIWIGYLKAMFSNNERYDNPEFRSFLRRYHHLSLLKGKKAAVELIDAERKDQWEEKRKQKTSI